MSLAARAARVATLLRWAPRIAAARVEVELVLRRMPLDAALAHLNRGPSAPLPDADADAAAIVAATGRLLRNREHPRTTCLHRALCRFRLVRATGLRPRFRLGIAPSGPLEGHAWIELGGQPVGEPEAFDLAPTFSFPP